MNWSSFLPSADRIIGLLNKEYVIIITCAQITKLKDILEVVHFGYWSLWKVLFSVEFYDFYKDIIQDDNAFKYKSSQSYLSGFGVKVWGA